MTLKIYIFITFFMFLIFLCAPQVSALTRQARFGVINSGPEPQHLPGARTLILTRVRSLPLNRGTNPNIYSGPEP